MAFQIVDADTGEFYIPPERISPEQYEDGAAAQAAAKALSRQLDRKFRVKRVLDNKWKIREQAKFDSGSYQHLPWHREEWWNTDMAIRVWRNHYPHISKKEPGMVAYTESDEKGMDNKRTWIKPGRYLEKHFGEITRYFGVDVKHLVRQFEDLTKEWVVHFATTEEEIEYVYRHGPDSCMSSDEYRFRHGWGYPEKGKWPNDYHACRVYAAGDLQVAYIKDKEKDEKFKVVARALVWPDKKTHSRCYGNEPVLKNELRKRGYSFAAPLGARLLRKPHGRLFIVPYVDQGDRSGAGALAIKDMKDHLKLVVSAANTYACNTTSGLSGKKMMGDGSYDDGAGTCAVCERDEVDTLRVYTGAAGGDYMHICDECRPEHSFICEGDGRHYHSQYVERIVMASGAIWSAHVFRSNGFICAYDGKRYSRAHRVGVQTKDGTKHVYHDNLLLYAFQCAYTGDWYRNDDAVQMKHGGKWSKRAFAHAGFKCKTCEDNVRYMDMNTTIAANNGETHCIHCKPMEDKKPKRRPKVQAETLDTKVYYDEVSEITGVDFATVEQRAAGQWQELVGQEQGRITRAPVRPADVYAMPADDALMQIREYTYQAPASAEEVRQRMMDMPQIERVNAFVRAYGGSVSGQIRRNPATFAPVEPVQMTDEEGRALRDEANQPQTPNRGR